MWTTLTAKRIPIVAGRVTHACNPSTAEVEIGRTKVQGHFRLHEALSQPLPTHPLILPTKSIYTALDHGCQLDVD